ncbi:hypothetical protein BCR39DRAFT_527559 [Naematelia encephala]|uniref:Dihydrodipicolinate synthase n=1 Tax=Naematelia encephala TaxID=71784 RepID=A0A1Y2BA91_9TREE|nr:hypothetical protein BCR39DRAFT_527559 [Naematelia encephala]
MSESATPARKIPPRGVYVPVLSFWKGEWNGDPDYETFERHLNRMISAKVHAIVLNTYFAEAAHTCQGERKGHIEKALEVLKDTDVELVVDCTRESLWETVERLGQAKELGVKWAVVGFPKLYADEVGEDEIVEYFAKIGDWVSLPIIVDAPPTISTSVLTRLSALENISGVILPPSTTLTPEYLLPNLPPDFPLIASSLGYTSDKSHGLFSPIPNVAPVTGVGLWDAVSRGEKRLDDLKTAIRRRGRGFAGGVTGIRYAVNRYCGYGGSSRSPLPSEPSDRMKGQVEGWLEVFVLSEPGLDIPPKDLDL